MLLSINIRTLERMHCLLTLLFNCKIHIYEYKQIRREGIPSHLRCSRTSRQARVYESIEFRKF